ncbi:MAG: NAD-dependent epimerase/dehydratase family protein [Lachnospiraceae bacterium]|nr:NAD-dependent epimerase/dehydratase family protein [Lachnospiraceae bacterium]
MKVARKKILITGGSGFVGRNLYEHLSKNADYEVYAPSSKELNCIDEIAVKQCLQDNNYDFVFNLAVYGDGIDRSKDGTKILQYNLQMFQNFAKYSDLYGKMIYAGSGAEYDKRFPIQKVKEEDIGKTIPVDQYGLMKYTVGQLIENSSNIYNFRLFGIFGKYEYWPIKFISNICCKALFDLPLSVRQNVYFDYLWIDDFLRIVDRFLMLDKPQYHTYNIVSGQAVDLVSLCEQVKAVAKKDLDIIVCKEGLANEYSASNDRINCELGGINYTSIENSVEQLYKWYAERKTELDIYNLLY